MLTKKIKKEDNWEQRWIELEGKGNVGLNFVINPVLYPMLCQEIKKHNSVIVDFGAGTNFLAKEFLYGDKNKITGLKLCKNLLEVRKRIEEFIGVEESASLVKIHNNIPINPNKIKIIKHKIGAKEDLPIQDNSVNVCVSRNFLIHLSEKEIKIHLDEVHRVLKKGGAYIFSILNPEYEKKKHKELTLNENMKYKFKHGLNGEEGLFTQYFKNIKNYEELFSERFVINKKKICKPISNKFKQSHERYYWENTPMAFVYKLKTR